MTPNQNKAHSYLVKIKRYRQMHTKALERIEALRYACLPSAIRYDSDPVQVTPTNRIETLLVETVDKERELETKHIKYINDVKRIKSICESLTHNESEVIMCYYVNNWSFKDISDLLNKSERQVYRIKNMALEKIGIRL